MFILSIRELQIVLLHGYLATVLTFVKPKAVKLTRWHATHFTGGAAKSLLCVCFMTVHCRVAGQYAADDKSA